MRRFPLHPALPPLLLPLLLLPLAACSGLTAPADAPSAAGRLVPDDELRGLLLLMVDQQRFDPFTVETALAGPPAVREELAVTLGRAGDRRAVSYLAQLVGDPAPEVRRAAVFALGELELERTDAETAARNLLVATVDSDRDTGRLAVEALGKLGVAVVEVARALTTPAPGSGAELDEGERWARLLPGLFRFDEPDAVPLALGGLAYADSAADPVLRRRAVFALARTPQEAALPQLRQLLADADPRVRGWAARAVGMLGDGSDLVRLLPLVDPATEAADVEPSDAPVVQALRAAAALIAKGDGVRPAEAVTRDWHAALLAVAADPRPQVRLELLDRVAPWLPADGGGTGDAAELLAWVAGRADAAVAHEGALAAAERAAALVALAARPGGPGAATVTRVENAAGSDDPQTRAAAAAAAVHLPAADAEPLLEALLADPEPQVKSAAAGAVLASLGDDAGPAAAGVVLALSRIADAGVQAQAFAWLAEHPVVPYAELRQGALAALAGGNVETSAEVVRAIGARGAAAGGEQEEVVRLLLRLAERGGWLLQRAAAAELTALGQPPPPTRTPNARRTPRAYTEIAERTSRPLHFEMVTAAGTLTLELDCPDTPLTCLNFVNLAEQGFFDGVTFHRVVPDFVVQGGDPRGDGYGGPGYAIRDEISRRPYVRGTLGMALAGPHTGSSQFFLCLSEQPHLDGGYTAFGEVVAGEEVLDRITRGTVIERVRRAGQ